MNLRQSPILDHLVQAAQHAAPHRFSAWKGLVSSVLGALFIAIPVGATLFILMRNA
jgi:hypothetical protein